MQSSSRIVPLTTIFLGLASFAQSQDKTPDLPKGKLQDKKPDLSKEEGSVGQYLWDGVVAERSGWRSGQVKMKASYWVAGDNAKARQVDQSYDLDVLFDYPAASMKYIIRRGTNGDSGGIIRTTKFESQFVATTNSPVTIRAPGGGFAAFATTPDPRVLGLVSFDEVFRGMTLKEVCDARTKMFPNLSARKVRDGRYELTCAGRVDGGDVEIIYQINEDKGFAVEESRFRSRPPGKSEWIGRGNKSVSTAWSVHGRSWLPTVVEWSETPVKREGKLELEWKGVNAPIDPEEFTTDRIGASKGTIVVDDRLGQGVVVAKIGMPDWVPPQRFRSGAERASWGWGRTLATIISLFIVSLVASYYGIRAVRRRRSA